MEQNVIERIEALQDLKIPALKKRYRKLFGEESKSSNKQFLFRRTAWRLQANAEGDLSERARRQASGIANDRDLRVRAPGDFRARSDSGPNIHDRTQPPVDHRLPGPGTLLSRRGSPSSRRMRLLHARLTWTTEEMSGCRGARARRPPGRHRADDREPVVRRQPLDHRTANLAVAVD